MRNAPLGAGAATAGLSVAFVLLWNSGFIGAEYAMANARTFTQLFWRYLALSGLLAAFLLVSGGVLWPGRGAALHDAIVGVLAHGGWLSCALLAIERGVPSGIVALVVALQPLTTGALSGLVTGERTAPRRWLGLGIGFAGVAIAVVARMDGAGTSGPAYLIPFGAVIAITIASLLQRRRELTGPEAPMATTLLIQSVATTMAVAIPAILIEGLEARWSPGLVGALAWLVVVVSLGAYGLMWKLLARTDATAVASLFYFGPPVTMLMAWAAFGDTIMRTDVIGLAVVALGVAIIQLPGAAARRRAVR